MSIVPIDLAHIQTTVENDARQLRTFISWVTERNASYQNEMTSTNMTAAGVSTADQNAITLLAYDLDRLNSLMHNTLPSAAANMMNDVTGVLGVS
jgi:hypothetical protein